MGLIGDKDIVDGVFGGDIGSYDVEYKEGKFVAKVGAGKFGVSAEMEVKIDAAAVLDAIAKAVPGQIDDSIIEVLKKILVK